jgi:hypothetical protein
MANDDSSDFGVPAQLQVAVWLTNTVGLEVLSFGRSACAKHYECELVLTGRFLEYVVRLDHDRVFVLVALMDKGDPLEDLFAVPDSGEGWQNAARVIAAMERSGIKSLERPFQIGSELGPGAFVFG